MMFRCPQCQQGNSLLARACPQCGFSLTLRSLLSFYGTRWTEAARRAGAIQCPQCRTPIPVGVSPCPGCGIPATFEAAVHATVAPPQQRLARFFAVASPRTRRWVQWMYLVFSAALLWWFLGYIEAHTDGHWYLFAALSILHIAAMGFLAAWLLPRRPLRAISERATRVVKLSLALNFFSAMLALQLFIGVWWARALVLATLFVVLWIAAWLLNFRVLPMAAMTRAVFLGDANDQYDPASPQGRSNVRLD